MDLLLYLQIKPIQEIHFQHRYAQALKESFEDLVIFEADQFSDAAQLAIGSKFIEEADRIICWVESQEGTEWKQIGLVFEKMRKSNKAKLIVSKNETPQLKQILKMIGTNHKPDASLEEIKDFLRSN